MSWRVRHQGSSSEMSGLTEAEIAAGIRDGIWDATDETRGPTDQSWIALADHPKFQEVVEEIESFSENRHPDETHLDMNALIDVCLVLLVFFILVTSHATVMQKIVPIAPPIDPKRGVKTYRVSQVQRYMVRVRVVGERDAPPKFWVEEEAVEVWNPKLEDIDVGRLARKIREHVDRRAGKTEVLLQTEGISWGTVVSIQDAAREAGIRRIHQQRKQ
ncbi:MAG: ExbD/TolR family protein [Gemmataceae bacterium]